MILNNIRRKKLREACSLLEQASALIQKARDEEEDSMNNLPENLQESVKYEQMEDAVENLDEALELIESIEDYINVAME